MEASSPKLSFTCFVIMPFSDTAHEAAGVQKITSAAEWTNIYQDWIKKAVESYADANITCKRSATAAGNFVKGIVGSLNDSNFVIADLTGNKANVFYELGIRHALRTGTIIITQHRSALPSDLQTYYCLEYTYSGAHHEYTAQYGKFESEIHSLIKAIIAQNFSSDSPVSDFLGYKDYSAAKEWIRERDEFISLLERYVALDAAFRKHAKSTLAANNPARYMPFERYRYDLLIARFYNYSWSVFKHELLEPVMDIMLRMSTLCDRLNAICSRMEMDASVIESTTKNLTDLEESTVFISEIIIKLRSTMPPGA